MLIPFEKFSKKSSSSPDKEAQHLTRGLILIKEKEGKNVTRQHIKPSQILNRNHSQEEHTDLPCFFASTKKKNMANSQASFNATLKEAATDTV